MEYQFNSENFQKEVLSSELPVLVDFYADWCGPCKMMAPVIETLAEKYDGRVKVGKCNVDQSPDLASAYEVMSVPTVKLFVKGEVRTTVIGAVAQTELEKEIERV